MKSVPLLDGALKKFNEFFSDKIIMLEHKASYLNINSHQYPRIYEIFYDCCQTLDMPMPPLFLIRSAEINAYTTGISTPLVCVTSGCVQYLSEEELRFIFGHELGHIKSQHLLYKSLATYLQMGGNEILIGAFPLVGVVGVIALNSALYKWNRMSEFTADRAGLLCVQDIDASVSALSKLAGFLSGTEDCFNKEEFIHQAEQFHEEYKEGAVAAMANMKILLGNVTHPFTVSRVYEINSWYKNGLFENVMRTCNLQLLDSNNSIEKSNICKSCGTNNAAHSKFCIKCGTSLLD